MDLESERKSRGLSVAELADMAGIDVSTIRNIESSLRIASPETTYKLEKAMNMDCSLNGLIRFRIENRFSRKYVSDKLYMSEGTLSNYENNPSAITVWRLKRFCELYNCEAKDIIGF